MVEAIDETVASYRMAGRLVGLTPVGHLIIELTRSRQIELHPHKVDLTDLPPAGMDLTWELLYWLSEFE
ncbi:MAG: hypothetical protein WCC30_13870 [Candidatus Dormiibacterota bacterium]